MRNRIVLKWIWLFAWLLLPGCQAAQEDPSDLMSDTWVATDALGRQMPLLEDVGPLKEGRHFTGIFYITWHASGNQLELSVPSALLGIRNGFDFKWADHCGPLDDPMFLQGDAAPNRRFNYRFIWQ